MNIINWRLPVIILILSTLLFLPLIVKASDDKEFFFATGWKLASMSYRDCILEAKKVLDFVKFNVKLDYQMRPENDGSGSAWGQQQWNNSLYKAVIRCVPTEKMVFFVVGGYNPNKVREYVNILLDNFQAFSEY